MTWCSSNRGKIKHLFDFRRREVLAAAPLSVPHAPWRADFPIFGCRGSALSLDYFALAWHLYSPMNALTWES